MENHEFSDELYQIDMSSDELMHYGRKGMKWYQRIFSKDKDRARKKRNVKDDDPDYDRDRDYELRDRRAGMRWIPDNENPLVIKRNQRKVEKQRKEALEKARAAKEAKKKDAEEKAQILKSGDRKKIIENKHRFTDDELRQAITRLELEERLSSPTAKKNIGKGEEIVRDILTNSAKNIGQQTVTYVMGYGMNKALAKVFDDPKVVNPKKGQKDK